MMKSFPARRSRSFHTQYNHQRLAIRSGTACRSIAGPRAFWLHHHSGGNIHQSSRRGSHLIARTSEFWWEEEEEFDAVTDALKPKRLVIAVPPPGDDATAFRAALECHPFVAAFCATEHADFSAKVWAGKDGPPLFLKMRSKAALDAGASAEDVVHMLAEILQQNWRMDLDAGLGVDEPPTEPMLIVSGGKAAGNLLEACGEKHSQEVPVGSLSIVRVNGTVAGEAIDWRNLGKTIESIGIDVACNTV